MFHPPLKRTLATLVLLSAAGLSSAQGLPRPSSASSPWYLGNWTCNIDGRTGWVTWTAVNDTTYCNGKVCLGNQRVTYQGAFRDSRAGGWVKLVGPSSQGNDLRFIYMGDYMPWFLRYDPQTMIATGNTIWRGKTYPLQCSQAEG